MCFFGILEDGIFGVLVKEEILGELNGSDLSLGVAFLAKGWKSAIAGHLSPRWGLCGVFIAPYTHSAPLGLP